MDQVNPEIIQICKRYYQEEFPIAEAYRLLTLNGIYREWAFYVPTLDKTATMVNQVEDVYTVRMWRHLFFPRLEDFVDAIRRLQPIRIDAGAIYPSMMANQSQIVGRETTLDFDVDDSDKGFRNRACACVGSVFCRACWKLVAIEAHFAVLRLRACGAAEQDIRIDYTGGRSLHVRLMNRALRVAFSPNQVSRTMFCQALFGTLAFPVTLESAIQFVSEIYPAQIDVFQTMCDVYFGQDETSFQSWYLLTHQDTGLKALYHMIHVALDHAQSIHLDKATLVNSDYTEFVALKRTTDLVDRIARATELNSTPGSSLDGVIKTDMAALIREIELAFNRFDIASLTPAVSNVVPWQCTVFYCSFVAAVVCMSSRYDRGPCIQPSHLLRVPFGINSKTLRRAMEIPFNSLLTTYPIV